MQSTSKRLRAAKFALIALTAMCVLLLGARHFFLYGQDKSGFPDGFDAVQAAPGSHKVIFENEFIRVLQVTLPPAGHAEPMHFHRWPSLFIGYERAARRRTSAITQRTVKCMINRARASRCIRANGVLPG